MKSYSKTPGLGLALGSGGARGFAHIAVIEALFNHRLYPEVITGSSMGAVIGAGIALHNDVEVVRRMTKHFVLQKQEMIEALIQSIEGKGGIGGQVDLARRMTLSRSVVDDRFLYDTLSAIFGKARFSDVIIPLGVVVCDYQSGTTELIQCGFIVDAIAASATIPGIFPPRIMGGSIMVDGGVTRCIPVPEAKEMGAQFVVGVDVGRMHPRESFHNAFDLVNYIDELKGEKIAEDDLADASLTLSFEAVAHPWHRFDRFDEILRDSRTHMKKTYGKELKRLSGMLST